MTRQTIPTPELQVGDLVITHGLRVRLDRAPIVREDTYGPIYAWVGTVENLDQVREDGVVPVSWLYDRRGQDPAVPTWNVQGNDLASWAVERD